MQTHVPSGRGLPGPSPPRTGLGAVSGFALLCRPKGAEGLSAVKWQFLEPLVFSYERPKFRAEGPGDPPGAGGCVCPVGRAGGGGGGSLAPLAAADLPVGGAGCRVQSGQLGVGRVLGSGRLREGPQELRGARLVRGLGCQQVVSARGHVHGPGVSAAGSCRGWCVLEERSQCLRGSGWGISPQEPPDGTSFQQHSALREGGQGWGARSCWQGLFSKPLGSPSHRCPPSTALLGKGAG